MQRYITTITLIIVFILHVRVGYSASSGVVSHLLFAFCHANIWHLACNLIALWMLKGRLYLIEGFLISLLSSYLPTPTPLFTIHYSLFTIHSATTLGFSAVLFAIIGIKWGLYFRKEYNTPLICQDLHALRLNVQHFFIYTITPLIITIFIPNINWLIHIYALTIGLTYGFFINQVKGSMSAATHHDHRNLLLHKQLPPLCRQNIDRLTAFNTNGDVTIEKTLHAVLCLTGPSVLTIITPTLSKPVLDYINYAVQRGWITKVHTLTNADDKRITESSAMLILEGTEHRLVITGYLPCQSPADTDNVYRSVNHTLLYTTSEPPASLLWDEVVKIPTAPFRVHSLSRS